MRKIIGFIVGCAVLAVILPACSGDTYAKRLKRERQAIERFIAENEIIELKSFPKDTVFGEKEYYKDPNTGIYVRVINKGSGKKPLKAVAGVNGGSRVSMRVNNVMNLSDKDKVSASNESATNPMILEYGLVASYTAASDGFDYYYKSSGLALPLEYVRNNSEVSLIIPFNYGSSAQQSLFNPFYYGSIKYRYDEY